MIASYIQRLAKMVIKKTLYDITNIKKTTHNGKLDNSSVISNKSSFSNDNIIQSNDNVKFPSTRNLQILFCFKRNLSYI